MHLPNTKIVRAGHLVGEMFREIGVLVLVFGLIERAWSNIHVDGSAIAPTLIAGLMLSFGFALGIVSDVGRPGGHPS